MKLEEARRIIRAKAGFRVDFEQQDRGILSSDHFPDHDEETIGTEDMAWEYARKFAHAGVDDGIVNVYVINGNDFTPVEGYAEKKLNVYP